MKINNISNLNQYKTMTAKKTITTQPQNTEVKADSPTSQEIKTELERRAELAKISPEQALKAFIETDPNKEGVERSIALSKKFMPIQQKLRAGKELSPAEKSFIQEHYPELYAQAMQIEQEVAQLKAQLKNSSSKEEANQVYMQTKMRVMGMVGKDNGLSLGLIPALDNAFRNRTK